MNLPGTKIIYSNLYYVDATGKRVGQWADGDIPPTSGYVFREVFSRDFPRGKLFRSELVEYQSLREIGFYETKFAMYEDWELRIRLTKRYKVAYCPEPMVVWPVSGEPLVLNRFRSMHPSWEISGCLLSS